MQLFFEPKFLLCMHFIEFHFPFTHFHLLLFFIFLLQKPVREILNEIRYFFQIVGRSWNFSRCLFFIGRGENLVGMSTKGM